MILLATFGNVLFLIALAVMFFNDGIFVEDIVELVMIVLLTAVPVINLIALYVARSGKPLLGNSWFSLYLKRRRLEEKEKIKALEEKREN